MNFKEVGFLFSGDMVRAILGGRKTQTRRMVKPQPICEYVRHIGESYEWHSPRLKNVGFPPGYIHTDKHSFIRICESTAPAQPGDLIYAKETFKVTPFNTVVYRADDPESPAAKVDHAFGPWKPSIFMPRALSRIDLPCTEVRCERVQDITESDALAEGVSVGPVHLWKGTPPSDKRQTPVVVYAGLWDSINGKGSWERNPWCFAYTFQVERLK